MDAHLESGQSSSLGWPFGLRKCMVIHTPGVERCPAKEHALVPLPFHQQFMNLQTTFLLPFFSDAGSSSSSDSDSRSEAASSFFKDSRRITLGSLIGLPMDHSFHALHPDAHYHVFTDDRRRLFLPSCGILALLGCVRNSSTSFRESELSEDGDPVTASATSLTAYLHSDPEDVLSDGSESLDWNDQFVSCHSVLSEVGEWTPAEHAGGASKAPSTPKPATSRKLQRSASMKSFFSSICCRVDAVERS